MKAIHVQKGVGLINFSIKWNWCFSLSAYMHDWAPHRWQYTSIKLWPGHMGLPPTIEIKAQNTFKSPQFLKKNDPKNLQNWYFFQHLMGWRPWPGLLTGQSARSWPALLAALIIRARAPKAVRGPIVIQGIIISVSNECQKLLKLGRLVSCVEHVCISLFSKVGEVKWLRNAP